MLLILGMYKYPTSIQREGVGGGARAQLQPRSWDLQYLLTEPQQSASADLPDLLADTCPFKPTPTPTLMLLSL